jgi:putative SOS response-associated peptidase YedK
MAAYRTIITGESNEFMREIHAKMPVILPEKHQDASRFAILRVSSQKHQIKHDLDVVGGQESLDFHLWQGMLAR